MKALKLFGILYGGLLLVGIAFLQLFFRTTEQGRAAQSRIDYLTVAVILAVIVAGFVGLNHLMDQEKA